MDQIPPPKEVKILETAEDIQERRQQVLTRYDNFKADARAKREKLEDSRRFQYFKRDADELESWILEKLQAASDESYKDPTNLQAKIQKHQAFEAEVAAHSNAIVVLDNTGREMINQNHYESETIRRRLEELHRLWEQLLSKLAEKGMKLQQALVLVQFIRHCDEVMFWINEKSAFLSTEEFGHDLEHVEVLQRKFDEFQKDMASQEYRVTEVNELADKLLQDGHPERDQITNRKEELNTAWQRLKQMTLMRQDKLYGAHEIQRFNRDADETVAWISEKDVVLSSDDYGRDLASVQALQRKHEGVERDLAALEDKVLTLGKEAERLCAIHGDHADQIQAKRSEIEDYWQSLTAKAKERRERLEESYSLHRFLADFRDLVCWINDMKAIISADELAKDVAGAEALLESHQEHRGEIDAREDSFAATTAAGKNLLEKGHYASDEVKEKLSMLESDKRSLIALWDERRILYEQCMDLQYFYRDTEQADTWMAKQEAFLANEDLGDSLDSVEALIKKHEDFEKSLAAQEEKIKDLDEFATKLIDGEHYAADDVAQRRAMLLERRKALKEKSSRRRELLDDAYRLQQFERDCDETKDCSAMETFPLLLLPDYILQTQVCNTCGRQLSVGPIGITPENRNVCGRCSTGKIFVASLYNKVAKYCVFKCDNRYSGCSKLLYFNELNSHNCKYGFLEPKDCTLCGCQMESTAYLVNHYHSAHPQYISRDHNYIHIDLSKNGLFLNIIEDNITKLMWIINFELQILIITLQGEGKDLLDMGITHFRISFIKPDCKHKEFSSLITSSSKPISISFETLKHVRGVEQTLLCYTDYFVQIDGEYVPFKKQIQNNDTL